MFGKVREEPQNEQTPFWPRSPYGVAKVYGHWITVNYRESYGIFGCSGICSTMSRPGGAKSSSAARSATASPASSWDCRRNSCWAISTPSADWGYAGDYVQAMWMMLQQDKPEDFVVATGVKHSVREMAELAFSHVGLDWREHVKVAPQLLRPAEVNTLRGDAAKARRVLGWAPKLGFADLVHMMVDADMVRVRRELAGPAAEPGAPFQGESA